MLLFNKSSEIHLDCFVADPLTIKIAPVDYAIKHIPEWWKALPNTYINEGSFYPNATMKKCTGMVDYYTNSIVIPLWSDLAIDINSEDKSYRWFFSDEKSFGDVHPKTQFNGFVNDNYGQFKIKSPWYFKTKSDINFLYSNSIYNQKEPEDYFPLNGLLNHSRQYATHIQLMLNLHRSKVITMDIGTPVAHITPLTEKKVVIHRHLVDQQYLKKLHSEMTPVTFSNKYKRIMELKEKFKTCPFKDHINKE